MRWQEEVLLLREEMRRVCAFLEWQASWWIERGAFYQGVDAAHSEGLQAYSHRQALIRNAIRISFELKWKLVSGYILSGRGMSDMDATLIDAPVDSDDEDA